MKKICKYILIFSIILSSYTFGYEQFGSAEKNIYGYEFKQGDSQSFLKKANLNMSQWEKETDKEKKNAYLQDAMRYYYLLSKSDYGKIEAYIGLGRIYDEMNLDRYAKQNFSIAYNINNKNPELNFRFGNFYYKRKQLHKAQFYYNRAYNFGLSENRELRAKMSSTYNMLANENLARKYNPTSKITETPQKTATATKTKTTVSAQKYTAKDDNLNYSKELEQAKKILLLDDEKSNFSKYYLFIK